MSVDAARILSPEDYPRRSQAGIYDPNILCAECDGRLGELDQHAAETLLRSNPNTFGDDQGPLVRAYPNADPEIIRLFAISLAWRAHHSSHAMFLGVSLGPYEALFKTELDRGPRPKEKTPAFVAEFDRTKVPVHSALTVRIDGLKWVCVYAAHLMFYVRVDKKPVTDDLSSFNLALSPKLMTLLQPWIGSGEAKRAIEIVDAGSHNRKLVNQWRRQRLVTDHPL
jgi:hypothetical protein